MKHAKPSDTRSKPHAVVSLSLEADELRVGAALHAEHRVAALLHDHAVADDADLVAVPDGAQPVCDDDLRRPINGQCATVIYSG